MRSLDLHLFCWTSETVGCVFGKWPTVRGCFQTDFLRGSFWSWWCLVVAHMLISQSSSLLRLPFTLFPGTQRWEPEPVRVANSAGTMCWEAGRIWGWGELCQNFFNPREKRIDKCWGSWWHLKSPRVWGGEYLVFLVLTSKGILRQLLQKAHT